MSKHIVFGALIALSVPAVAAAQQPAAGAAVANDWKAANKAMGQALEAKDAKSAAGWAAAALTRYRATGAPNKGVLANLALNLADTSAATRDANVIRGTVASLASVDAELAQAGRNGDRIPLLRAIGKLKQATGDNAGWKQALDQVVETTRATFGPEHHQVAVALVERAVAAQAIDGIAAAQPILAQAEAITAKLPENDLIRAVVDLSIAGHDLEANRPAEASRRYEALMTRLDPAGAESRALWWTASERLARLHQALGQSAKADAIVATMIARTPNNSEVLPVILLSPDRSKAAGLDPKATPSADVSFDIGPDGKPVNVKAKSDVPAYATLADAAVKASRYIPIIKDGKPQPTPGQTVTYRDTGGQ